MYNVYLRKLSKGIVMSKELVMDMLAEVNGVPSKFLRAYFTMGQLVSLFEKKTVKLLAEIVAYPSV